MHEKEKEFKPPGFPFHSLVVHAPVGAWSAAVLFDGMSRLQIGGNAMVRLSFFSITLGLVAALLAIPTGVLDWGGIKKDKPAWKIGLFHMAINLIATMVFAMNLGVRLPTWKTAEAVSLPQFALSGIGTVALFAGAYLGGRMVYDHGIGVARRSKEKWRGIAVEGGARVPKKEG
jgi:uncharacterized membrane protein